MTEPAPEPKKPSSVVDQAKKYDTVVSNGQSALRALLTMNGGAIIVFLTFLGHLWDAKALIAPSVGMFVNALSAFIIGIFLALVAYCFIFVSNCCSLVGLEKLSKGALVVTFAGGLGSLIYFPIGSCRAIEAFQAASMLLPR